MRAALALAGAVLWAGAARAEKDWAVLLYLQAAPDLGAHAVRDLRSIECAAGAASGPRHDVVAQLDRARLHLEPARAGCGAAVRLDSSIVGSVAKRDEPEGDRLRAFLGWAI